MYLPFLYGLSFLWSFLFFMDLLFLYGHTFSLWSFHFFMDLTFRLILIYPLFMDLPILCGLAMFYGLNILLWTQPFFMDLHVPY